MENAKFGKAYRHAHEKREPSNPERRELLEQPREWMYLFNELLSRYLTGKNLPDRDALLALLHEYEEWTQMHLEPIAQRLREMHDPTANTYAAESELDFHRINGAVVFMWDQLLYDRVNRYTPAQLLNTQLTLATTVMPLAQEAHALSMHTPRPGSAEQLRSDSLQKSLSEADVIIALIEMMKTNPDIIVVPAPSQYENNPDMPWRNIDAILIDRIKKEARGIQTKSFIDTNHNVSYDNNFVTLIDSSVDLGNSTTSRLHTGKRVSMSGQLAMNLLSNNPLNSVPTGHTKPNYMRQRLVARELSRERRPYLTQAVGNIANRVITDLYK